VLNIYPRANPTNHRKRHSQHGIGGNLSEQNKGVKIYKKKSKTPPPNSLKDKKEGYGNERGI